MINLDYTINSGQVFLWKKYDDYWYGVDGQNVLKCDESGPILDQTDFFRRYDDMKKILELISVDDTMKEAVKRYSGLQLLRQDPFQCCITFMASANANIQKIRNNLEKLCYMFGSKITIDEREFHLFPESHILADANEDRLLKCGLGYRAKYVKKAAKMITNKIINFDDTRQMNYYDAKKELMRIPGIGNKVADCILLFSLDKQEAFPLDRWIIKVLQKYYPKIFDGISCNITDKQYDIIHERVVKYFGSYAGYAQQFLFKMERENNVKKW